MSLSKMSKSEQRQNTNLLLCCGTVFFVLEWSISQIFISQRPPISFFPHGQLHQPLYCDIIIQAVLPVRAWTVISGSSYREPLSWFLPIQGRHESEILLELRWKMKNRTFYHIDFCDYRGPKWLNMLWPEKSFATCLSYYAINCDYVYKACVSQSWCSKKNDLHWGNRTTLRALRNNSVFGWICWHFAAAKSRIRGGTDLCVCAFVVRLRGHKTATKYLVQWYWTTLGFLCRWDLYWEHLLGSPLTYPR